MSDKKEEYILLRRTGGVIILLLLVLWLTIYISAFSGFGLWAFILVPVATIVTLIANTVALFVLWNVLVLGVIISITTLWATGWVSETWANAKIKSIHKYQVTDYFENGVF